MGDPKAKLFDYVSGARPWGARTAAIFRRLGPVGPVALISMTLPGVMGIVLIYLSWKHSVSVRAWISEQELVALVIYVCGFALLAGFPVLPTYSLSLIGGFFLGFGRGTGASLTGYMGAAAISYAFLRALSGNRVEAMIDERPRWKAVRDELIGRSPLRTLGITALLRLPPNLPFAVVNLVLVTSLIRPGVYFLGTFAGVVPRTLAVVYVGATASSLNESGPWQLKVAGLAAMLIALGVLTQQAHRALRKITRQGS